MDRPVDEIPVEAMARFTTAEACLYPMALTDPAGYERATTLVGLVADELRRSSTDVTSVLERRSELIDLVSGIAAEASVDARGFPVDAVVDAASALRCREFGATGSGTPGGA